MIRIGKKTEYDESKIKLDNQEKVDGTKRQDKGKITVALDKSSDEKMNSLLKII